jgi:hypothetical protein
MEAKCPAETFVDFGVLHGSICQKIVPLIAHYSFSYKDTENLNVETLHLNSSFVFVPKGRDHCLFICVRSDVSIFYMLMRLIFQLRLQI